MSKSFIHYSSVLFGKWQNSIAMVLSFRTSFMLSALVDVVLFYIYYLTIDFLFRQIDHIGAWGRNDFMFFICFVQTIDFIQSAIGAPNFWNFSYDLRSGSLDYRLLRPVGALFDVFTAVIRPTPLILAVVPLSCLIYFGIQLQISVFAWVCLPFLLLLAFSLLMLTELFISMFMFWTVQGDGVNFFRIHTQSLRVWPDFMFQPSVRAIFSYALPCLLIGSVPTRFLLGQAGWLELLAMLVATLVLAVLTALLWRLGLRRYESASS